MKYTKIIGTGSYFPEKVLTNEDLTKMVETSDQWIVDRTGMRTRHIASLTDTTTHMAFEASKKALEMAGIDKSEVDGIIFCTVSPENIMPSCGAVLGDKLGIRGPFAFDLNTACSGFLYALHMADGLIRSGKCKTILIAASERLSAMVDYTDRGTCILFGDGAGAAVVRADNEPGVRSTRIHADGSYGNLLYMHGMGTNYLAERDKLNINDMLIKMSGNETFKLAVRSMTETTIQALDECGLSIEDINYLVPHQANIRIIEAVAKRFNVSMDNVIVNVDRRANTSAATIPTALDEGIRTGKLQKGHNIAMTAFGGGMSWGSAIVTL